MTTDQKTPGQALYEHGHKICKWEQALPTEKALYERRAAAVIAHDRANQPAAGGVRLNLDPNIRWGKHRVRMTFGLWDYRVTLEESVGGNCRGLTILESAIANAYDNTLMTVGDVEFGRLILSRSNGDTLECDDDGDEGISWLEDMLVGYEVIAFDPETPGGAAAPEAPKP